MKVSEMIKRPPPLLTKEEYALIRKAGYWPGCSLLATQKGVLPVTMNARYSDLQFYHSRCYIITGEVAIPMPSKTLVRNEKGRLVKRKWYQDFPPAIPFTSYEDFLAKAVERAMAR